MQASARDLEFTASSTEKDDIVTAIEKAADAQHRFEHQLRSQFGTHYTDFRGLLFVFRMRRRGLECIRKISAVASA